MNDLGIAYMPFTFPTFTVLDAIQDALPESRNEWTRTKVNDLYFLYQQGVKDGFPIVSPGQFKVKEYMMKNSAFSESDIRVFLYVLYELAQSGDVDTKYWNIELQKTQSIFPGLNTNIIEKYTGAIKWGSIALLVAAGLWVSWPFIKKIRSRSNG